MRKLILMILLLGFCLLPSSAFAATNVTFVWDPNREPDMHEYRLYQSPVSGQYTFGEGDEVATISHPKNTITIPVEDGTWYWVLTALDTSGNESGPSNEVTATIDSIPPVPPKGLKITVIVHIQ